MGKTAEAGLGAPWWPVVVRPDPGFVLSPWFRDLNVCAEIKQINVCLHA